NSRMSVWGWGQPAASGCCLSWPWSWVQGEQESPGLSSLGCCCHGASLGYSWDPTDWSPGNVQKWILWTEHQYRLPQIGKSFQELSGKDLCAMSEEQFCQRSPACGDILHAHLDIWKSGRTELFSLPQDGEEKVVLPDPVWADSEVDSSCTGQPIHLWQFLKELLLKPHNYGRFIRIFKIEDSAQVARLWGIRKNRPAMNYDKLSRSIRQYYKKGIIRKPDISQRLVYQFGGHGL
uniref:SAM pointed domain containing ETS transcription factor n=1 Tax=Bubo bubo TaxID=30461 RepID=A0A8C0EYE4_BUBBB